MNTTSRPLFTRLALCLSFSLFAAETCQSQVLVPRSETYPSNTASFGGTGSGNESGFGTGTTGTGVETGMGLGSTGTGMESNSAGMFEGTPAFIRPRAGQVIGEGMPEDLRSPDNPALIPYDFIGPPKFTGPPRPGDRGAPELTREQLATLSNQLYENSMKLADPEVKVRALDRLARSEIFGGRLDQAIKAVSSAFESAKTLPDGTVKNIRLVSLSTTSTNLTDGLIREALEPNVTNRREWIDKAINIWRQAADISGTITNADLKSEMMSRVAFDISEDAQLIAAKISEYEQNNDVTIEQKAEYEKTLDELFDLAIEINQQVPMNVWRNEVAQKIAIKGALAYRFERALNAARTIKQNAPRALALARVAEALARFNKADEATQIFIETGETASRVSEVSVRNVVAGDLVDRLIALGRFRDARMSVYLYEDDDLRLRALGAVAENQARRGLAHHAVDWINIEVQPEHRAGLIKRVQDGTLQTIQATSANANDVMMYEQPSR
jgi:hypothetical protein